MADSNLNAIVQRMIDAGESEDNIATVIRGYKPQQAQPDTSRAVGLMAIGKGLPAAADASMEFATNPQAWKAGKTIGEIGGGLAGLAKAGPLGAAGGMYAGGRAGWRLMNGAQRIASPLASGLEKVAPYAQSASTLSGAQGINDLAQMAEPNRKDIGFLGIGPSQPSDPNHPAIINAIMAALAQKLGIGQ